MLYRSILVFLILCLPLGSTPLVNELMQISSQWKLSLDEAEKALNALEQELKTAKSLQTGQGRELGLLKSEARALRTDIESLKKALTGSEMQLLEAERQLQLVETHTADLRQSFENYKKMAARGIRRQKIRSVIYVILAGAAGYGIGRLSH